MNKHNNTDDADSGYSVGLSSSINNFIVEKYSL